MFTPKMVPIDELGPGEIGFITAAIKTVADCNVGDTITDDRTPGDRGRCPASSRRMPVVLCGLFPVDADDFEKLRDSLGKLRLNDASFHYETETSRRAGLRLPLRLPRPAASGDHPGAADARIRPRPDRDRAVGGLPHPHDQRRRWMELHNPADMPDVIMIDHIEEPWIKATIMVPDEYLGSVLKLCKDRRGQQVELTYVGNRAMVVYRLPLNEVVFDFYDRLKSVSPRLCQLRLSHGRLRRGRPGQDVDPGQRRAGRCAVACIVHRSRAEGRGRAMCEKLKDLIPRHLFKIADPGGDRRQGRSRARRSARCART